MVKRRTLTRFGSLPLGMDRFLENDWNLDQIRGWAETRDPEIIRAAAWPRFGKPKKSLEVAIRATHSATDVLREGRDIDGELWAASGWPAETKRFEDPPIVQRYTDKKNRKTFTSTFFPVGSDIEIIVTDWISFLKRERMFGQDDPLFPATKVEVGKHGFFAAAGLDRVGWRNATTIRRIFRRAFQEAELPYFNPHSFRKTLAALGEKVCTTPEAFKAWSQNLSHENVLTTFTSYGAVAQDRQSDILNALSRKAMTTDDGSEPDAATVQQVLAYLQKKAS
jgi:hypothetical protein